MTESTKIGTRFNGQCISCKTTAPAQFVKSYIRFGGIRQFPEPYRVDVYKCSNCGALTVSKSDDQSNLFLEGTKEWIKNKKQWRVFGSGHITIGFEWWELKVTQLRTSHPTIPPVVLLLGQFRRAMQISMAGVKSRIWIYSAAAIGRNINRCTHPITYHFRSKVKLKPECLILTYLAQVRQLHFKSEWLKVVYVPTMRLFLPTKQSKKHGMWHKAIVTIGIARVVDWDGQSKNTDVWYQVAGNWHHNSRFISSRSLAEGRK